MEKEIKKILSFFEIKTKDNGEKFVILKDNAPKKLKESIRAAHGDRFPDDFVFTTYLDLLERIQDFPIEDLESLENNRHEIVDGYVNVYTYNLTKWLHDDINNVYYLTQAIEELQPTDGFQLLASAQFLAIDAIMQEVVNYLEGRLTK